MIAQKENLSSIEGFFSTDSPKHVIPQNPQRANLEGEIVTPLPKWQPPAHSVCGFDGGTRFSLHLDPGVSFCHFQRGVYRAIEEHHRTWQPVPFGSSGLSLRGASRAELSYFRDLPERGFVLVCDDFRAIIRESVIDRVSCQSRNDCVIILGWRMFTHTPSISAAYRRVCDVLRSLGLVPSLDCINRLDVNVTVDNISMAQIRETYVSGMFATRSAGRVFDARPGRLETLYFGRHDSPVMFRCYDKSAEIRKNLNTEDGRGKLRELRGLFPEESLTHLVRFEWEMHKSFLSDYDIKDFDDLETKLLAMLKYLSGRWIRVLETRSSTDRHLSRQKVASWWQALAESLEGFAISLTEKSVEMDRAKHKRTSGERSFTRSFSWLKIAANECLSLNAGTLDAQSREDKIDALAERLARALKTAPIEYDATGWGTGSDLAWNFAIGKIGG